MWQRCGRLALIPTAGCLGVGQERGRGGGGGGVGAFSPVAGVAQQAAVLGVERRRQQGSQLLRRGCCRIGAKALRCTRSERGSLRLESSRVGIQRYMRVLAKAGVRTSAEVRGGGGRLAS